MASAHTVMMNADSLAKAQVAVQEANARDMLAMYRTSMPDVHQEWISSATSGDLTFIHFRLTGTNSGPWGRCPPPARPPM